MEFDEYDYLEKTVENPEPFKSKEVASGGDDALNSGEEDKGRSAKHKSKEKDGKDDGHRSLKRSNGDESRDQDRHRERNSFRHRSRSRDREQVQHRSSREHKDRDRGKEREKDRDREERNGKERDRDAERERGRDKRERGREREREKERERSRRSRSRSERRRSDLDEREKEKSRDKEYREPERERESREHDKESRRHREKKEEPAEPEADPERDQRTVFAYQICLKARDKDVYDFFSRAGKVRDVRLIMDRNSRRSKGVGYVEFYDVMSVPMAIALSGQPLLGQPVMVKPSEAEKNLAQSTTTVNAGSGPYSGGARKLYVGNLHYSITEDQLRQVFEPFGTVELVQLPLDETGHCKGFGFVQFAQIEDARSASNLNGQVEIAGRPIKVSIVTDQPGNQGATNAGDFDDDEGGGLALNARSRAMLMLKLDRSGTASSIAVSTGLATTVVPPVVAPLTLGPVPALHGPAGAGLQLPGAIPSVDTIGVPSECLLLKNMFDPSAETDADFDLEDIKEDVQVECARFGNLKHIFVDKNSAGFVYLRFENPQSAVNAQRALNGRWFAGKMITAAFMVPQSYEAKFPDS